MGEGRSVWGSMGEIAWCKAWGSVGEITQWQRVAMALASGLALASALDVALAWAAAATASWPGPGLGQALERVKLWGGGGQVEGRQTLGGGKW